MIDAVDETLLGLLRTGLDGINVPPGNVAAISPADANGDIRCGIFLYASIENPSLKNEPPRPDPNNPHGALLRSPLTLDLYYLLTAYGNNDPLEREERAHEVLSVALRVLYDSGVIKGSQIALPLRNQIDELRLSLIPITIEDMTRIWSVFPNQAYRPSVSFLVTPVPIFTEDSTTAVRVVERQQETGIAKDPIRRSDPERSLS